MKLKPPTAGITFTQHVPKHQTPFERLFEVFKELITHTSGDFDEAINWLRELDIEYGLTTSFFQNPIAYGLSQKKDRGALHDEFCWWSG